MRQSEDRDRTGENTESSPLTDGGLVEDNSASQTKETKMEWHIYPHEDGSGDWVVQGINVDEEGEIFTTIFTDSNAEARAREYCNWQRAADNKSIAA